MEIKLKFGSHPLCNSWFIDTSAQTLILSLRWRLIWLNLQPTSILISLLSFCHFAGRLILRQGHALIVRLWGLYRRASLVTPNLWKGCTISSDILEAAHLPRQAHRRFLWRVRKDLEQEKHFVGRQSFSKHFSVWEVISGNTFSLMMKYQSSGVLLDVVVAGNV